MNRSDGVQQDDAAALLEEEWYLVRDSGELPETAFHSSIYYLTAAADGPRLRLDKTQRHTLFQAAALRFIEIILRDLDFAARMSPAARGVGRAIVNYHRLSLFCRRQSEERWLQQYGRGELRAGLERFFCAAQRQSGTAINCTLSELQGFAADLGVPLPAELETLFSFAIAQSPGF